MSSRRYLGAGLLLIVVVVVGYFTVHRPGSPPPTSAPSQPPPPAQAISISIASAATKQAWLHQAVRDFNARSASDRDLQVDGKAAFVVIIQEVVEGKKSDYRSGTMVSDTLSGKIKATVLSPGDDSWISVLKREWQALNGKAVMSGEAPVLVRTPLVIAMWESRARALGCWPTAGPDCTWERVRALSTSPRGWGMLGQPAWHKLKLGIGYTGESNSGTLSMVLVCMLGAKKTSGLTIDDVAPGSGCGKMMAAIEKSKVHSGNRSGWLLEKLRDGGPEYVDAIITNEAEIIGFNRENGPRLREPLVAVYPQDGTLLFNQPYAILDGAPWVTPEQVEAAKVFRKFLLSEPLQDAVASTGLRPALAAAKLASPFEAANGVNAEARLAALDLPDSLVINRVIEVWHKVRKHAVIVLVFDKSGSMAGEKISASVAGAKEFVARMDLDDTLMWLPFDNQVYPGPLGPKSQLGEKLLSDIGGTTAAGGTSLYDTILMALDTLEKLRTKHGDSVRYGIVILSDGQDTNSQTSLTQLQARLQPTESDPTGIQIHTIAIGKDADENVLRKIASSAHGRFWKGQTKGDMVNVYQNIATYY
jgi:Ca-activated chloride channel family protein